MIVHLWMCFEFFKQRLILFVSLWPSIQFEATLNKVPAKFIHKPWEMELKYQEAIKTIIGKDYPSPIVIHERARVSALEAFKSLKK